MGIANLLLKGAGKLAPAARKGAQLASKIKVAKTNKVAGTIRKTCLKGKNCSATCIAANKLCLVSMSPPVTDATNKMAKFLKSRQKPGGTFTKATYGKYNDPVDTIKSLSKDVKKAQIKADVAKQSGSVGAQNNANMGLEDAKHFLQKAQDRVTLQRRAPLKAVEPPPKVELPPTPTRKKVEFVIEANDHATDVLAEVKDVLGSEIRMKKHFFKGDPERLAAYVEKMKPYENLTDDQLEALGLYGTATPIAGWPNNRELHRDLNKVLRTGNTKGFSEEELETLSYTAGNLKAALESLPATPKDLYRGLSTTNAKSFKNMKVGDEIRDNGFGSLSGDEKIAKQFVDKEGGAMLVVKSKTARDVSPMMPIQEAEHIALPGTKYRVVAVDPKGYSKGSRYAGDGRVAELPLITLEEV
jgi:hypothetical protein